MLWTFPIPRARRSDRCQSNKRKVDKQSYRVSFVSANILPIVSPNNRYEIAPVYKRSFGVDLYARQETGYQVQQARGQPAFGKFDEHCLAVSDLDQLHLEGAQTDLHGTTGHGVTSRVPD